MRKLSIIGRLCIGLVCLSLTAASCPNKTSYETIASTEAAVLAANAAYLDSVVTGQTSTNSVPTVEAAFNDTQLALHAAAAAAQGGASAPVPPSVAVKASNFTNLAAVVSAQGKK